MSRAFRMLLASTAARVAGSFLLGLAVCAAGVCYAALVSGNPVDGQRGGVIVVAASFWLIFSNYRLSASVLEALNEETDDPAEHEKIERKLKRSLDRERNLCLAVVAVTGTLFAGFGDIVAAQFIAD